MWFQSVAIHPLTFQAIVGQNITVGVYGRAKMLISWWPVEGRDRGEEGCRGRLGSKILLLGVPQ